MAGLYQKNGYY